MFRQLAPLKFLIRFQAFWHPLRGDLPHIQIFMNGGTNSLTRDAQLLGYWFNRNPAAFQDLLLNLIISGVDTVLDRPGQGATQVEKSPCLNWATQFLMVAYHGACSPNVSVRMTWISFGALHCGGKKYLYDNSRSDVVEIARVAWHASFQPL